MNKSNSTKKFVNLHAHSGYSIGDGMGQPSRHLDFAQQNGLDAHAFTDHGNMSNVASAYLHQKKMVKDNRGIKVIKGIEAYFVPSVSDWKTQKEQFRLDKEEDKKLNKVDLGDDDETSTVVEDEAETKSDQTATRSKILRQRSHLVMLAQNEQGMKDLFKLTSMSHQGDNFYYYPRIDYDMLRQYGKNLIISSACLGGPLSSGAGLFNPNLNLAQIKENQLKTTKQFKQIFGDRFFLELQWNAIPEQHKLNQLLIEVAKETDTQLISTADCHYPDPKLFRDREIYKKLAQMSKGNKELSTEDLPTKIEDMKYQLYPKNFQQMVNSYEMYSQICGVQYDSDLVLDSITRTWDIAHRLIDNYEIDTSIRLPKVFTPEGLTSDEHLKNLCYTGLRNKNLHNKSEYLERLEYELSVFETRSLADYFIVTHEAVKFAKQTQFLSPGRGSSSGTLTAYLLGITQMDPIHWDLYFERFLTPDGTDWPDIDIDFERPAKLKEDLNAEWLEKYNIRVVPVPNYNSFKPKSLIKDVSKLHSIDFQEVNEVTNKMEAEATSPAKEKRGIESGIIEGGLTFEDLEEFSPTYRKFMLKYPEVAESIGSLSGEGKTCSVHAAGCVIAEALDEKLPLTRSKTGLKAPFPEGQKDRQLEPMGFLKFDFLGLNTEVLIHDCISNILEKQLGRMPSFDECKEWYDKNLDPSVLNFSDQEVYKKVFWDGNFPAIFQFSQRPVQSFVQKVKPKDIFELGDVTATFRPGPLSAKVDELYLKYKNEDVRYAHPLLEKVFKRSNGVLIYQETITQACHVLANMTINEGNKVRKLIVKKGIDKSQLDQYKIKFLKGGQENGIEKKVLEELWHNFERAGQYLFSRCLSEDTSVETIDSVKNISDVEIGDKIKSKNGFVEVKNKFYRGKKKVVEIELEDGRKLKATLEHKFETKFGLLSLSEILKRDLEVWTS